MEHFLLLLKRTISGGGRKIVAPPALFAYYLVVEDVDHLLDLARLEVDEEDGQSLLLQLAVLMLFKKNVEIDR